jgi:glycosyltransferase involved in cell wall biosynthesis
VYQFVPYLEAAGHHCTVRPFSTRTLFRTLHQRGNLLTKIAHTVYCSLRRLADVLRAGRYDLVVIHREAFPFFTPAVERLVFARNRNVVYSFDDAVYAGHGESSSLRHPLLYRLKYSSGVNEVIARSVHVMAGNEVLASHARQFNDAVSIFPTVVDLDHYTLLPKAQDGDKAVTIGWSGYSSTAPYVAAIEAPLRRLAVDHPGRVRFLCIGAPDMKLDLPDFEALPFRLESVVEDLRKIDIGLMPMPDTPWTRGKCSFKAIQYMALGIPTIASPVGMNNDLIQHNENGLFASGPEEWYQSISRLVADAPLRSSLGMAGRATVAQGYSLQIWGPRLVSLLESIYKANHKAAEEVR